MKILMPPRDDLNDKKVFRPSRLTLVIASLGRGGAERTMSLLAGAWVEQGREVTLITLAREDVPAYPLHPGVELRQLQLRGAPPRNFIDSVRRNLRIVAALRRAIRESSPDLVLSFLDISNILTLLATRRLPFPVVVSERIHPAFYRIGRVWEMLRRVIYPRADALVCMAAPPLRWFQRKIKVKGYVIPNPIEPLPAFTPERSEKEKAFRWIVGMGRLDQQKGFDLLLRAFAEVAANHPQWRLKILGDGPLKEQLAAQALALGLSDRVEFAGALSDPFSVLRVADLFVFSSRYEGFGNALCEAMACGLASISFDCPSGPADIIRHDVDGLLVSPENVPELAAAMARLMGDPQERSRLASRAPEVVSRFSLERILGLWDEVFAHAMAGRSSTEPS
jgi:glycosyltransferase involved in cell wall biosynthesis